MINSTWRWTWFSALAIFILAGSTGFLMRVGGIYGFPFGLQWSNIRHAHSHLMFFGWVMPALAGMIYAWLPRLTKRPYTAKQTAQQRLLIILLILFAILAYAVFLFYGYSLVPIGDKELPIAVIFSGFSGLVWYGFLWSYWRAVKKPTVPHGQAIRFWNIAAAFLFMASLAAWGVAITARIDSLPHTIISVFTYMFLDTFSEGWFTVALLGLIYAAYPQAGVSTLTKRSETLLIIGLPVVFLLGMPTSLLPMPVRLLGGMGGILVGLGLWSNLLALWPHVAGRWRVPLFFLGLKATALLAASIPPIMDWAERAGMRISYIHWLLLGFITLGLIAAAQETWGKKTAPGLRWMTTAVIILICALIPLTRLWPSALAGRWVLTAVAVGSLLPVLAAINIWISGIRSKA